MSGKKILSAILLLFVAAAVVAIAWKDVRRRNAVRSADAKAAPAPAAPSLGNGTQALPSPSPAPSGQAAPAKPSPEASPSGRTIVVTYFVTNTRCFSCYKIETLTESAVTTTFAIPLEDGRVQWRVVNTDEPANAHYLKDYKLAFKSVIVSEVSGGREVRWKNCEKVWDLLDDPKAFESYIVKEVKAYLGDA